MAAGGITFKTESTSNFENIFLEPEREFDEPKTGLEGTWGGAASKAGEVAASSDLDQKAGAPTWVNLQACALAAFSPPRGGVEDLGDFLLEETRASHPQGQHPVPHTARASRLGHIHVMCLPRLPPGKRRVGPKLDTFEASP